MDSLDERSSEESNCLVLVISTAEAASVSELVERKKESAIGNTCL